MPLVLLALVGEIFGEGAVAVRVGLAALLEAFCHGVSLLVGAGAEGSIVVVVGLLAGEEGEEGVEESAEHVERGKQADRDQKQPGSVASCRLPSVFPVFPVFPFRPCAPSPSHSFS